MANKQGRSGHAAGGSSQVRPLGDWPIINLKLADDEGEVDYWYDSTDQKGQRDDSASAGDPVRGTKVWTFEVHTKLTLDQQTFADVRAELKKRDKAGRKRAYKILTKSQAWKRGGPAGQKMIKEALQAGLFS